MTRQDAYKILKEAGHTPAKALEIVIDAERGQTYALEHIKAVTRNAT